ncbi:MAG: hypothetical protein IPJ03_10375 [Ignavibacteriales bacterium]|nr:hypothetical protein [Ignavibacteriales bacterium]MBK7379395.1 hypothetical protein [Ignavibacteriales bacterium]
MGQQQLLLIVIGLIVVAIAIAFAITLFRQNAADTKRDIVMTECMNLGNMAMTFYEKPKTFGGGGFSFEGWDIPDQLTATSSGYYTASVEASKVIIIGTGNDVVNDDDSVKVQTTVEPNSVTSEILN